MHTDTAIVGAGPYGLSLSAHLTASGIPHEIFGEPMQAWRSFMPSGMLLRSEAFATSLYAPTKGYLIKDYFQLKKLAYQPVGMRLPLETFIEYALWFQERLVKHLRRTDIVSLHHENSLFHLGLSDGSSSTAKRVVIALGLKAFEQSPIFLQGLPNTHVTYSSEFGDLSWARDKDITIVGGGQSALGLAALLHEQKALVHVLARERSITWNEKSFPRDFVSKLFKPEGGLGPGWRSHILSEYPSVFYRLNYARRKRIIETSWGPSGAWWLRDRVEGKVDLRTSSRITSATIEGSRVRLNIATETNTATMLTDRVILATGFKIDLQRHVFLSPLIKATLSLIDGAPKLSQHFETNIPGLFIIGPASAYSFGPAMRFIYGAKYVAPHLAKYISNVRHVSETI